MNLWIISWLDGRSNRRISTVSTAKINVKFSTFIFSVYGMPGKEALVVLTNLSQIMAEKLEEPISHVRGWVNSRSSITFVRSYY